MATKDEAARRAAEQAARQEQDRVRAIERARVERQNAEAARKAAEAARK